MAPDGFCAFTQDLTYAVCVQVYNVALYVEADPAKATLQLSDPSTDSVCSALLNGQFQKVLQIHMLRDVTSTQFKDGLRENLVPNLKKYGGDEHLETFMDFFSDKKIGKGSEIPLLWSGDGHLHVAGPKCHAQCVMHVAVPNAHKLSFTELKKSHTELLASTYICMHDQIWVRIRLVAMISEQHHL